MAGLIGAVVLLICLILPTSVLSATEPADEAAAPPRRQLVEDELLHAETYYWFGMAEEGNMRAFLKGLNHLQQAEEVVRRDDFSPADKKSLLSRIAALRTDLDEQIEIAHDTLRGIFPLSRFLVPSLFADATSMVTFEVLDDPTVMAATFAAKKLALQVITGWTQRHHLDVVFNSVPKNPMLENETLYVFNTHPKFFVHNYREVVDALPPELLQLFDEGKITPEVKHALLDSFVCADLLVVTVHEADVVDDDYFYVLDGRIYHPTVDGSSHTFRVMGFSRDRNVQFYWIFATTGLLLALAYAAFGLSMKVRRRASVRTPWVTVVALPLIAFTVGRCLPWVFAPLIRRIAPIPETLAIVSFWVPCAAGIAFFIIPMFGFWLLSVRFLKFWPMFNLDGRAAAVFAAIGAGAVAYIAVPAFLYLQDAAVPVLIPLTIAVLLLAQQLGRALDSGDRMSMAYTLVPISLSLLLGAAAFQCSPVWLWGTAGLLGVASALPALLMTSSRDDTQWQLAEQQVLATTGEMTGGAGVRDVHQLGELAENPPFQKFPEFQKLWQILSPLREGRCVHLLMHGTGGTGLSSSAVSLMNELQGQLTEQGIEVVRMQGECSQPMGEPTPYAPFQQALAQHFEINLLTAPEAKLKQIDVALGEIFESVIPFAGILFPASGTPAGSASSRDEINTSIAWMFRKLSKTKSIILFVDDAQWLDESSKALLRLLLREFPPQSACPIAIIVASHNREVYEELGVDAVHQTYELHYPTIDQQVQILVSGVGLKESTARTIVERIGAATEAQGGLFWLLQVVGNLARNGALQRSDEGFELPDEKWPEDVFIPDEMRGVLKEHLRRFPQYRMILECAACACDGREFSASVLAEALGEDLLELLARLDMIDRETSIVYDVCDRDDAFAFQSSFMLDVVREELRVTEEGPVARDVPQLIRGYHVRLAAVLEESLKTNSNKLYRVANHYYAAGASCADKAVEYNLRAANAACAVLDFDAADRYLGRADECAQLIGRSEEVESERLYIECLKAHVTGAFESQARLAARGVEHLQQHPTVPMRILLAIAQVHYDAGKSSGDRSWFDKSLELGQRIIELAQSPYDEALGRHFVGISLPFQQHEERTSQLSSALQLLEAENGRDPESVELTGRVMGSLAEELSRGTGEERDRAKELFERRLQWNESEKVGDPRGQAMTHGGLGRLAFFSDAKDLETARHHFQKDLDISSAIGDLQGQIQMHSLLGACALESDVIDVALDHYQHSWDLSQDAISRFFAGTGLLQCYIRMGDAEQFEKVASELLDFARDGGIPQPCASDVLEALDRCPPALVCEQVKELLAIGRPESQAKASS